ncbi:MAG TPA: hypothetical protein VFC02_20170, partial [Anaerolineales bacterium]|nr:hypothetical protein [Anaerolineales bacterium]
EEAASELVQKELEAMRQAAVEMAENVVEKASNLMSSITDIVKEYASGEISRDTSSKELNQILSHIPKTEDVKG